MLDELHAKKTGRSVHVQQKYDHDMQQLKEVHGDTIPCPFCTPAVESRVVVADRMSMVVIENDYPYEFFDNRQVSKHLIIVPRRHIGEFAGFTPEEKEEFWQLMTDYQEKGYALFTRPVGDVMRSVPLHLHSHAVLYEE